jgi:hypothetical protein
MPHITTIFQLKLKMPVVQSMPFSMLITSLTVMGTPLGSIATIPKNGERGHERR